MCVPVPHPAAPRKGLPGLLLSFALYGQLWSSLFLERAFSLFQALFLLLRRTRAYLTHRLPGSNGDPNGFSLDPGQVMFGSQANEMVISNVYT